jgi:hypothetical protein
MSISEGGKMKKRISAILASLLFMAIAATVLADWEPGDGHKMHWPQTPKEGGIDVSGGRLADDWLCTQTGSVTDVHFWISWYEDYRDTIYQVSVEIYRNLPVGHPWNPYEYPVPDVEMWLWDGYFSPGEFVRREQPPDTQGWLTARTGVYEPENHTTWEQINITDIQDPFVQLEDSIYWLSVLLISDYPIGWKETDQNWNANAIWWGFIDTLPIEHPLGGAMDLAFVITGGEGYSCGDGNGDGNVTVADAIYIVGYIYGGGPEPVGEGDVNLDGRITVADAVYIVGYIYGGGPPPCEPALTNTPVEQRGMER